LPNELPRLGLVVVLGPTFPVLLGNLGSSLDVVRVLPTCSILGHVEKRPTLRMFHGKAFDETFVPECRAVRQGFQPCR
jgi:hypothetical protein